MGRKKSKKIGIGGVSNLEADILKIVWETDQITVRDVYDELRKRRRGRRYVPYTTVMSTMSKLAKKRLLQQNKTAKAYRYTAAVSREDLAKSIVQNVIEKILDGDASILKLGVATPTTQ